MTIERLRFANIFKQQGLVTIRTHFFVFFCTENGLILGNISFLISSVAFLSLT